MGVYLQKIGFDTAEDEPPKIWQIRIDKFLFYQFHRPGRGRRRRAGAGAVEQHRRCRRVANLWQNFGKMLLVFGCTGPDFCKKICVLQHFSKSTRFSS